MSKNQLSWNNQLKVFRTKAHKLKNLLSKEKKMLLKRKIKFYSKRKRLNLLKTLSQKYQIQKKMKKINK